MILGCFYVSPENSTYRNSNAIYEVQHEIIEYFASEKNILLLGDFNAKTKSLSDIPENINVDDELITSLEIDDLSIDFNKVLKDNNLKFERSSQCTHQCNTYGRNLIDFCKTSNFLI